MIVITVARKPMVGTAAKNVLAFGTGAINVNDCRVGYQGLTVEEVHKQAGSPGRGSTMKGYVYGLGIKKEHDVTFHHEGRWPPNLLLEHHPDCRRAGSKRIKPVGSTGHQAHHSVQGIAHGAIPHEHPGFLDAEGKETIDAWDCVPGCPCRVMDNQGHDMGMHSAGNAKAPVYDHGRTHNFVAYNISGGAFRVGDAENGTHASRFFPQFMPDLRLSRGDKR